MFLKRLDLFGFKSFADRTEIEFVRGLTAVVGPNGSGKSNVADAIRWALGEQSARSLRGARMEDVIFSGSETRKALNFCEVSLTFDNADGLLPLDFGEVTVTRRYYRSGESEYLLNRQTCRLRDIVELLMDTGVGREAYSLIGQGQIDEILSNRPEDRRGIFEEAAGIVKFKTRRREAERKLAEAAEHHGRVRDILAELDGQMGPLQERAAIAQRYQELQRRMAEVHIALLAHEAGELLSRRDDAVRRTELVQSSLEEVSEQVRTMEADVQELRRQADGTEYRIGETQNGLLAATAAVEQCEAERRLAFERHEHALAALEEMRLTDERLQAEKEELEREQSVLRERREELRREQADALAELERRRQGGRTEKVLESCKAEIANAREELIEVMRRQAAGRNELQNLEQKLENARRGLARAQAEEGTIEEQVAALLQRREEVVLRAGEVHEEGRRMSAEAERADQRVAKAQQALQEVAEKLEKLERTSLQMHTRLTALQDMQRDMDGYAAGPRAVLLAAQAGKLSGIRGAVADLIDVPEKWRLAVETALGGALQHIVAATEASARQAIELLRRRQAGRATFLPQETIRGRRMPPHDVQMVKSAAGFVGVAAELVEVDGEYRFVIDSLLGNVLVVETLPDANRIARVLQHRVRIVTQEGDVVNPGGSMTGGATGRKGPAILGRQQEIEALLAQEKAAAQEIVQIREEREKKEQAVKAAHFIFQQAQARLAELARAAQEAAMEERTVASELEKTALRKEAVVRERVAHDAEAKQSLDRLVAAKRDGDAFLTRIAELETRVAVAEDRLQSAEDAARDQGDQLTELRVSLAQREEAVRGVEDALRRLEERMTAIGRDLARLQGERADMRERLAQSREDRERYGAKGREAAALRDETQAALVCLRAEREERVRILDEGERVCAALRAEERQGQERLRAGEAARARAEAEVEAKIETLRERYGVGLELALAKHSLAVSAAEARLQLTALKKEQDALGDVSVGAVEEYERLAERYRFLREEERDLNDARTQLQTLLDEMDTEMARRFQSTFEDVRGHFSSVFHRLFDGGRADIRLTGEDPLCAGIEIVAEPPGKKMQSLTLLSGGERALTALALLFAILHVKPVPFCILDEVEAALDEANVSRFADYLRTFADVTQFVLITHRRGTMEAADVLYGVTVHESGVSRLVSVRLVDGEVASA